MGGVKAAQYGSTQPRPWVAAGGQRFTMPAMIAHAGKELRISGQIDCDPAGLFHVPPERDWLIAHCKPRQEKCLCRELSQRGIPRGIFLERRLRRYPGKGTSESLVPLLGGYVFCIGNQAEHETIYRTERVARIIRVVDSNRLAQQLQMLALLLERTEGPMEVRPDIVVGTVVTITRGTLAGLSGVVVRRKASAQLVVNLTVLGTSVAVELPVETAELLDA